MGPAEARRPSNAGEKAVGYVVNDWQLSGSSPAGSGNRYDLSYSYNTNGGNREPHGLADYGARIVYTGDPGMGCSSNQYGQFNTAVTGPTYEHQLGLESGRNVLRAAPITRSTSPSRATSAWAGAASSSSVSAR